MWYPPNLQDMACDHVLEKAELLPADRVDTA